MKLSLIFSAILLWISSAKDNNLADDLFQLSRGIVTTLATKYTADPSAYPDLPTSIVNISNLRNGLQRRPDVYAPIVQQMLNKISKLASIENLDSVAQLSYKAIQDGAGAEFSRRPGRANGGVQAGTKAFKDWLQANMELRSTVKAFKTLQKENRAAQKIVADITISRHGRLVVADMQALHDQLRADQVNMQMSLAVQQSLDAMRKHIKTLTRYSRRAREQLDDIVDNLSDKLNQETAQVEPVPRDVLHFIDLYTKTLSERNPPAFNIGETLRIARSAATDPDVGDNSMFQPTREATEVFDPTSPFTEAQKVSIMIEMQNTRLLQQIMKASDPKLGQIRLGQIRIGRSKAPAAARKVQETIQTISDLRQVAANVNDIGALTPETSRSINDLWLHMERNLESFGSELGRNGERLRKFVSDEARRKREDISEAVQAEDELGSDGSRKNADGKASADRRAQSSVYDRIPVIPASSANERNTKTRGQDATSQRPLHISSRGKVRRRRVH